MLTTYIWHAWLTASFPKQSAVTILMKCLVMDCASFISITMKICHMTWTWPVQSRSQPLSLKPFQYCLSFHVLLLQVTSFLWFLYILLDSNMCGEWGICHILVGHKRPKVGRHLKQHFLTHISMYARWVQF